MVAAGRDDAEARMRAQYEVYPYPERDPADEARRLITGSPGRLPELAHFVFAGRLPADRPLRVLVAGGGTGDGLIQLAQGLADAAAAGRVPEPAITYVDLSEAARAIAEQRAAARGLDRLIRFETGSLLDLAALAPGLFDYIDCCGVLHHLADPAAGLAALTERLAPGGGLGLMVYGTLGRTGVYPLQSALRRLTGDDPPDRQVALARKLIDRLPDTNWFKRNPFVGDHKVSDAGLYDLLLHSRDRAFTVPQVCDLVAGAGLAVTGFQPPLAYDPAAMVDDPALRRRIDHLPETERWALAEELSGARATHAFYAVPTAEAADRVATLPPPEADGAPTWTVYDPVRNRYFRIGRTAAALIHAWHRGDPDAVLAAARAETGTTVAPAELERFRQFLEMNDLTAESGPARTRDLLRRAAAARPHWSKWLLTNYLFLRIPIVRPDAFLDATLPVVRPLMSRAMAAIVGLCGLLGIVLAIRQWDQFVATFLHFFSLAGVLWFGLALIATKIVHELAHAYTAKRFGCRVHTMGVAFLVLWPVLYTDVSDAWRLASRRARLQIGAAGMASELALACLATLAWSFLPDGPVRAAAFLIATATWAMTLFINLNPFLKFDGYYLLSDLLGVSNLQGRSFALGRWRLREAIFGFGEPAPEPLPRRLRRGLIVYAWLTWVWRFFLFIGIALLIYHFFIKVVGILLMVVELAWFIARPVRNEMAEWWKRRGSMRLNLNLV
ncbi:MAG: methyltransferase, partial [Alphaproteobacteria bacterium]|nr:methyltransferase [Alphaproteobacteria bacterium]